MPWGSWITCEETVNGPDVGADFTGTSNTDAHAAARLHLRGAGRRAVRPRPITSAGRFAHEAAAFSPEEGIVYLTEDNFAFPSGLYRYIPPEHPMTAGRLLDGGRLQMLRVVGVPLAHLEAAPFDRRVVPGRLGRHRRPGPTFPLVQGAPISNNDALVYVGDQGRAQGAAGFSRLEGASYTKGEIFFTSTQGGGDAETGRS